MGSLPTELLSDICSLLDRPHLPAVCRVNRRLHAIATRTLYQNIDLRNSRDVVGCCRTVATNPVVAHQVRIFDVHVACAHTRESIFPALSHLVRCALQNTPRLRTLRLCFSQHHEWVISGLTFPNLQSFATVATLTRITSRFLARHPTIERLLLAAEPCPVAPLEEHFWLPQTTLPVLRAFTGPSTLAKYIVPGSPVVRCGLSWGFRTPSSAAIDEAFEALSRSTATVRVFDCLTPSWAEMFLAAAARHLPDLQAFGVTKDNALERLLGVNDMHEFRCFLAAAAVHIEKFSKLVEITFVGGTGAERNNDSDSDTDPGDVADEIDMEASAVHAWGLICPTLVSVTLPSLLSWRPIERRIWIPNPGDPRGRRWLRDKIARMLQNHLAEPREGETSVQAVAAFGEGLEALAMQLFGVGEEREGRWSIDEGDEEGEGDSSGNEDEDEGEDEDDDGDDDDDDDDDKWGGSGSGDVMVPWV